MKKKKYLLYALISIFVVLLGSTAFVSYSANESVDGVVIKSITPLYDKNSNVEVDNDNVIFNDKNQTVDYKIIIKNNKDYDIVFSNIKLSSPTEEFLKYEIEKLDDYIIKSNATKEIILSLETTGIKGWGRNFEDELTANISFTKYDPNTEVVPPIEELPDKDEPEQPKEDTSNGEDTSTEDKQENNGSNSENKPSENKPSENKPNNEGNNQENNKEEQDNSIKEESSKNEEENSENNEENPYTSDNKLLITLISATTITGIAIVIVSKNKLTKYTILIIMLGTTLTTVNAEEIIELEISINASFESQNVMSAAQLQTDNSTREFVDFWRHATKIKNIYIQNTKQKISSTRYTYDVTVDKSQRVKAYLATSPSNSNYYDLYIQADGIIYLNEDASYYFYNMKYLEKIDNIEGLDTSNVTNADKMFYQTGYYATNLTLDLSKWNMSNVKSVLEMFNQTGYNTTNLSINLSNWNISKVTDTSYMFYNAGYNSTNITIDLKNINTSNVKTMKYMFSNVGRSNKNLNLDLSDFDTSKVTDMSYMFYYTGYNSTNFALNISNFNTSNVTNMSYMFHYTGYSNPNFTLNVSNFDTSKVTNTSYMFYYTGYNSTKLNTSIKILNSKTTSYSYMFTGVATKLGSKIIVHYTKDTKNLAVKMIATKSSDSYVIKATDINDLSVGDEIILQNGEMFNVVSQTNDSVTMLAKYNIGSDHKQTSEENYVDFAPAKGWEYKPGPKDVDIQTWGEDSKNILNKYIAYLQTNLEDNSIDGDLISLSTLEQLGCRINNDYSFDDDEDYRSCVSSSNKIWLVNGQRSWTKSATSNVSGNVWVINDDGYLNSSSFSKLRGIRPVITISKETLKKHIKTYE